MGPDMSQYLDENGNPIAAPAKVYLDDNGEPIKQAVTPTPGAVLRAPTQRERFTDKNLYPVGLKGEGVGENLKNLAQRAGVGVFQLADEAVNPGRTVRSIAGTVLPDALIEVLNKSPDAKGREIPVGEPNPLQSAYEAVAPGGWTAAGNVAPMVGQMIAAAGFGEATPEIASDVRTLIRPLVEKTRALIGTSTTIPRVLRPLVEKTREAQKAATESADEYANAIKQKTGEIAADQSEKSKAAKAKGIEQERTHQKSVEETKVANKAAIREQGKIAPTKDKLEKSAQEMQAQIETAREKALGVGNQKYSTVNAALNPIQADPDVMRGAIADATEALKGSHADPTLLKQIVDKLQRGDAFTYEDLQGDYSRLGTAISRGSLPGDEFHAYDVLHEAIGDEMQRIADTNGQGPQLKAARDYWRRMKQAFGKVYNPTDVANVVLDKTAGSVMRQAEQANRLRLLGSFDKTIPQTAEHISNLQKGIEALPKEQPLRSVLKPLPEKPSPVLPPKFEGTPEELAKQQTKLPKPVGKTVIDRADIEATKAENLQNTADWIGTKGLAFAIWPAVSVLRSFVRGAMPDLGAAGAEAGATIAAARVISRTLEHPTVVKFLTQATDKDIASIPPELRGDLPAIIRQAQKKGMTVSPALIAAAAGSAPKKTSGDLLRQAQ